MKLFIKSRPAFNHRALARQIAWSPTSFHQWLKGERNIPREKERLLETVLTQYGYDSKNPPSIIGMIGELTRIQRGRTHFQDMPVGTRFVIIDKHDIPGYDITGYFIKYPPQRISTNEYYFTGYVARGTWKIVGNIADCIADFHH